MERNFTCTAIAAALAAVPATASAQGAPEPAQAPAATQGDIVVTARRREERLQDVPISISAVTGSELKSRNITNAVQLSAAVPSLTATPGVGGTRSSPTFALRGLSQQELVILNDQSVSTYIGDIVAARTQGLDSVFFDLGSVEVLKGPQGTLFGRNSTGGAIIIRPARPTNEFGGYVSLTYGNFDTINTEGAINLPVIDDKLMLRLAGTTANDDGYVHDDVLGKNIDRTNREAIRASLLFKPSDRLESLFIYNYYHADEGGTPSFLFNANPNGSLNTPAIRATFNLAPIETLLAQQRARGMFHVVNGQDIFARIKTHDIANTTTFHVSDGLTIKNIIGYRKVRGHLYTDQDGSSNSLDPQERFDVARQFTEELQILGNTDRLDWIIGAYYFRETGRNATAVAIPGLDPGPIEHPSSFDYPSFNVTDVAARNISYALYAQGTYKLSPLLDGLSITVGGRITKDIRNAFVYNHRATTCSFTLDTDDNPATPEVSPPLSQCLFTGHKSFSEPTYNVSLEYRPTPDLMVYVATRHGYRSGGFGARANTEAGLSRTFRPEKVDDIEIGAKGSWTIGSMFLRADVALYRSKYRDIQRLLTDPQVLPITTVTTNAGRARIKGAEVDVLFRPVRWLELTANYAHTDAKFTEFIAPDGTDLSRFPFARAPKNVYTLGGRITPLTDSEAGDIYLAANYYHTDSYSGNDNFMPSAIVDGYGTLNFNIGWNRVMGSRFDLEAFMTNATDNRYSVLLIDLFSFGFTAHVPGKPRAYGATLRYRFGS